MKKAALCLWLAGSVPALLLTWSAGCFAAFSEAENGQLDQINRQSAVELQKALDGLKRAVDRQIKNNPDNAAMMVALNQSWGEMIDKKCQLETVEAKGTDAEIATVNGCLINHYQQESRYFDNMLP